MTDNIHISFDLDGTLIDSIPLMKLSWENVSAKLNLGIGWEVYRKNIGLPFSQICKNLSLEGIESEVYDLYFRFNQNNVDKIKPMDGLKDLTKWMDMSNVDWSIITSKPKITTNAILELLDLNPKFLITADDVENGKPCIDSAELLTSQLNDKIDMVYYIGDTTIDHLFAINSGFEFIEFRQFSESQYILNNRQFISNLLDIKKILFE